MAAGILYLVATPIGNLGDLTFRAVETLRDVPLIACEDTRLTRRLLTRYEIRTRTKSYHARSPAARSAELLVHLRGGADLGLVTDAGTPGISDPGTELAAAWVAEGGQVVAIPGASAVLAAVAVSSLAGPRWVFEGFLPRAGRERRERVARIASDVRGSVIFEAPRRLGSTIRDLAAACGPKRPAAICRELTKLHEQVVRGTLAELAEAIDSETIPALGEAVIVVGWYHRAPDADDREQAADGLTAALVQVEVLVAAGLARGDAARQVAAATGLPRRQLYLVSHGK